MAEQIVNMLPGRGSFGSMTPEQILEFTRNPPPPEKDRGGPGTDPMGRHLKASEITPEYLQMAAQAQTRSIIGARIYHRKRKEEGTIIAEIEAGRKVRVKRDDGSEYNANVENLTRL